MDTSLLAFLSDHTDKAITPLNDDELNAVEKIPTRRVKRNKAKWNNYESLVLHRIADECSGPYTY